MKFVGGREGQVPYVSIRRSVLELFHHRGCSPCPHIVPCLGICEWHERVRPCSLTLATLSAG